MLPTEIFLSHSNLDQQFVNWLVGILRQHGVPIWYSQTNIKGAQQWHDEIGAALKRCDWFIVVLSPNSVKSRWVKRELIFALNDMRYENKIIPLLHQQCDADQLSWVLSSFQSVDFSQDPDNGCRNLLRIFGLGDEP